MILEEKEEGSHTYREREKWKYTDFIIMKKKKMNLDQAYCDDQTSFKVMKLV